MAMDPKSKNIDCYFYFYSECVRGNFCKFRHEPLALGCEDVCMKWKDGNCTEAHCSLRHMELKKKRKEIPCYWEKQPGGCRKAHCAFKHQSKPSQGELPNSPEGPKKETETSVPDWRNAKMEGAGSVESTAEASLAETSRRVSQGAAESYSSSPAAVEPIVVNFEEESDSESAPSWTPTKMPKEKEALHVKTLEEIRLEKIQAESAAYWEGIAGGPMAWEAANPAANPSGSPCNIISGPRKTSNSSASACSFKKSNFHTKNVTKELDFQVLTLDEIRKKRARRAHSRNGIGNRTSNHSSKTELLTNGLSNHQTESEDCKAHSGVIDLRSKLSSTKPFDKSDFPNGTDSLSSKRQRQISPQSGPNKKQRVRLRRLNEMVGDKETGEKLTENLTNEGVYEDLDSDFVGDIDKLLMELE